MSFAGFNMKVKVDEKERELVFPSGLKAYAPRCVVGISPNLATFGGYEEDFPACGFGLTQDERKDLANYMIDLWTQYKEKLTELEP